MTRRFTIAVAMFLVCSCAKRDDSPPPVDSAAEVSWATEVVEDLAAPEVSEVAEAPDVPPTDLPPELPAGPVGTLENPIPISALPYTDHRDGEDAPSDVFNFYSPCAPAVDESGPEWFYRLEIQEAGVLRASLDEVEGDDVDMDVHILDAPAADHCLARGHAKASAYLEPGSYWIVVDTWRDGDGVEYPGPYTLEVRKISGSLLPDEAGFNHYVVEAINDLQMYPKDGTFPYCWSDACKPPVDIYYGMINDGYYMGQMLFEGTGMCYCCGHTLEIFLEAYRRWQEEAGVPETTAFGDLSLDDVDRGAFYQYWYGWGVTTDASSGDAFEYAGIGMNIYQPDWHMALTGDFVQLNRNTGTGHAVIFVNWVKEEDEIVGIRYYGCNGGGDSHPDPDHPDNTGGNSGPSFKTEYLEDHGGALIPEWLHIGRAFDPATLNK